VQLPEVPENQTAQAEPTDMETAVVMEVKETEDDDIRRLSYMEGDILVYEEQNALSNGMLFRRIYDVYEQSTVIMGRWRSSGEKALLEQWSCPKQDGIVRYFAKDGTYREEKLVPGAYDAGMVEVELQDGTVFVVYPPKSYLDQGSATMEHIPQDDMGLVAALLDDRWVFNLSGSVKDGPGICDYLLIHNAAPILSLIRDAGGEKWFNYTQDGEGKWCYDGYYRTAPSTYVPSGPNFIYRCPASYMIKSYADLAAKNYTAECLTLTMLDVMTQLQNSSGYWETASRSGWLWDEFGFAGGFYDTRFNTDLMEIYCQVYRVFGGAHLLEVMERYVGFFEPFVLEHHYELPQGGWLVEDYWYPYGFAPTHSSLNHHLAECLNLYHLSDILQSTRLGYIAHRMLVGVEVTAENWIKSNQDLYYRYMPDGTYVGNDYPYLTYNDLLALQEYLYLRNGKENQVLNDLMAEKKGWMDRNGIKEYSESALLLRGGE